jgi:competence protein ComEC
VNGDALDLRLAGLATATWLSALAALRMPLAVVVWAAVLAAAAAAVLALAPRTPRWRPGWLSRWRLGRGCLLWPGRQSRRQPGWWQGWWSRWRPAWPGRARLGGWRWAVVGVLLGSVCGAAATGARLAARDAEPLADLARAGAQVNADLTVREDPVRLPGATGGPPTYLVRAQLTRLLVTDDATSIRLSVRVVVLASNPSWYGLLPGQRVEARARLDTARGGDLTAAVLSASGAPRRIGEPAWFQRAAGTLRAGLQRACVPLPDEPGGLLPGLVVGDVSRLDPAVADNFRATGMTHLTAVSGSNVAIIVGAVLLLARWARSGPRLAAVGCVLALVGFVILARPSPSVLRAAAMGALALVALAAGRPRAVLPALCAAVTVLVIVDPELAGDAGFALSVLATGGLLLIAPRWRDGLRRRGVPAGLAEALVVPAAAQVACAPVVAGISSTVSLVAVPANLLVVPAVAPATILGVLAAVVSPVWPGGAEFAAWLGGWPAWWLVTVARYGAEVPSGVLPWPGGVAGGLLLAGLTVAFLVAARRRLVRRLVGVVAAAVVVGALPVRMVAGGWPPPGWVLVACAVGQGDAAVLPVAPGQAVVVDAGPEPVATDRCLRRLRVRVVPLLVVSHFHADHVGGVSGVFRGRTVRAVLTTAWAEPAAGRDAVIRAAAGARTPVQVAEVGQRYAVGGLTLSVIGPPKRLTGTRSDPNNNSLVLQTRVRGVRILLAGDAEEEEQQALLEATGGAGLAADVLKVAHHGSAFQDPRFLDVTDPAVAVVSVGKDNRYGHPNAAVLERLSREGARVVRTDRSGDVAAVRARHGLAVVVRGLPP